MRFRSNDPPVGYGGLFYKPRYSQRFITGGMFARHITHTSELDEPVEREVREKVKKMPFFKLAKSEDIDFEDENFTPEERPIVRNLQKEGYTRAQKHQESFDKYPSYERIGDKDTTTLLEHVKSKIRTGQEFEDLVSREIGEYQIKSKKHWSQYEDTLINTSSLSPYCDIEAQNPRGSDYKHFKLSDYYVMDLVGDQVAIECKDNYKYFETMQPYSFPQGKVQGNSSFKPYFKRDDEGKWKLYGIWYTGCYINRRNINIIDESQVWAQRDLMVDYFLFLRCFGPRSAVKATETTPAIPARLPNYRIYSYDITADFDTVDGLYEMREDTTKGVVGIYECIVTERAKADEVYPVHPGIGATIAELREYNKKLTVFRMLISDRDYYIPKEKFNLVRYKDRI